MVDIHKLEKFPTALVEMGPRILFTVMILEGKDSKGIDPLCPAEFLNTKCSRGFAKHHPIEIQIAAPHMKVFHPIGLYSLFAKIELDASWLASAGTSGVHNRVRLKESPKKVVCDFMLLKKRTQTFGGGRVGFLNET
jgi:hypothetical protein